MEEVVSKTERETTEQALDSAYFPTCSKGAQHNRLPKEKQHVITYSITLVIMVLVECCGIYPSSSRWIVPHVQLQAKENLELCKKSYSFAWESNMQTFFAEMPMLCVIHVYDIADGKDLYIYRALSLGK